MDKFLISAWNSRVTDSDTVCIAGDFCFRSARDPKWYLRQLNGEKILIIGNHDAPVLRDPEAMGFFSNIDKMMHISDAGQQICICHFPIAEWNGFHKGSWHIYGHIHNRKTDTYEIMKKRGRALNAGCMINGYMPVTFSELVQNNKMFQKEK